MTAEEPAGRPERVVEPSDSLVELKAALVVRQWVGWQLLSAGLVSPGRWWAEYDRDQAQG